MQFAQWSFDELALKREYANALRTSVEWAVKEFQGHYMAKNYFDESDKGLYVSENDGLTLTVTLTANHLKAWLMNWGTGEYMNKKNPDYERYIESNYYAHNSFIRSKRLEFNNGIVYRGAGVYTRPNYEEGSGTVTAEGKEPAGKRTLGSRGFRGREFTENAWHYAKRRQETVFQFALQFIDPRDYIIIRQEVM